MLVSLAVVGEMDEFEQEQRWSETDFTRRSLSLSPQPV